MSKVHFVRTKITEFQHHLEKESKQVYILEEFGLIYFLLELRQSVENKVINRLDQLSMVSMSS